MAEEKIMEEKTGEKGEFGTRMEVLWEEMWTTGATPPSLYACIHQQAVVDRIGR